MNAASHNIFSTNMFCIFASKILMQKSPNKVVPWKKAVLQFNLGSKLERFSKCPLKGSCGKLPLFTFYYAQTANSEN